MFHRFHDRFGTAGLVIAVIALVAALGGTALAAGALSSKQKKEVTKIAKKYAGKPGANGATGTNGTNGTNGAKGDTGEKGDKGDTGTAGASVTSTAFEGFEEPAGAGEPCAEQGGTEFEAAAGSVTYACNGETGFTSTLPPGKTEQGDWSILDSAAGQYVATAVSFNIPLSAPLPESKVHLIQENGMESVPSANTSTEEVTPTHCGIPVGTPANPKADPGNLCVYATAEQALHRNHGTTPEPAICALGSVGLGCLFAVNNRGADASGFGLFAETTGSFAGAYGTWAVTAAP